MKSGWGIFFGIPFTLSFRPDMTQARADFIWLPTEMRPRPDSWPPSTRQRTKMWVAQPAAAEAESRWRCGLVLSQHLPPFKDAFGFALRLKHSTRSPVRRSAVVAALHAMGDTRTGGGGTKGFFPEGVRDIIFHRRLRISHVQTSKWRAVRYSEDLRIDGDERKKTRGRPASSKWLELMAGRHPSCLTSCCFLQVITTRYTHFLLS